MVLLMITTVISWVLLFLIFGGGMNHSVAYKNWTLSALFTFSKGNEIYNYTRAQLESGSTFYNQTPLLLKRWRAEGR